ncbi:MAG: DUF2891 domain-containing protein [Pyrinomonadaceae bacterium]|nr:DUF2891 domain-containing protein [Pyrinomonadaceae bacterium]
MKLTLILAIALFTPLVLQRTIFAKAFTTSERAPDEYSLTPSQASRFARLALKCVSKEYPNKPDHVINNPADVEAPKNLHPAFYGCYDWHSSVHGHWMLVKLIRTFPAIPEAQEIRNALGASLSRENILTEVGYLKQPNRQSFERTYGWAWLLKLAEELHLWEDVEGKVWSENLRPLSEALATSYITFLPKQTYPIRTGVHPNTAFGLAFALDYARTAGNKSLEAMIVERSLTYFGNDAKYPAAWEPGGEDFFSPALMEADLMRRVLKPAEFRRWFHRFLPGLSGTGLGKLLRPAVVADRADPKIVHLDGLNLSRAWCMRSIATALPPNDPARRILTDSAKLHASDALAHVASGDYAGEHWLASFAVYMLSTEAP